MVHSPGSERGGSIPAPGLLILTGPSHSGKTSVAREVLAAIAPPVAYLSVDDILEHVLLRPPGDRWEQIPLAYELVARELGLLLDKAWFVIAESTFTYVPPSGDPELHNGILAEWVAAAASRRVPCLVAQLLAAPETILARSQRTGRLDPAVIAGTVGLHATIKLPARAEVVHTDELDAAESARLIIGRLSTGQVSP
ncbi:MAG TPA: AAA family ATPase [Solirubrobacterales bacterium]|jgi:hypothetical protein